jgi:hypothetical protein
VTCSVEADDGFTRIAPNPGYLPLFADFIEEGSLKEIAGGDA